MQTQQLQAKDRKFITGAVFVVFVVAALLGWGYFKNQQKAAEPTSAAVGLAETAAAAAKTQPAK